MFSLGDRVDLLHPVQGHVQYANAKVTADNGGRIVEVSTGVGQNRG